MPDTITLDVEITTQTVDRLDFSTATAMIVYQLTLGQFLAAPNGPQGGTTASFADLYAGIDWVRGTEIPIISNPRYATALPAGSGSFANLVLLDREPEWHIVGGYIDTNLLIDGDAKGKKLSRDLILRSAEHRLVPQQRQTTVEGHAALAAAHKYCVTQAVGAGLDVPQAVRDEYGL